MYIEHLLLSYIITQRDPEIVKKKKKILNSIKGKCLLSLASKSDNVDYDSAVGVCRLFVHGVHTMEMQSLPHVFLPFPKQPELSCICLHKIQVV